MSKMNNPVSIVDTPNPFANCTPAYIPAGYPSQECIPEICLTHTERDDGEPFNPVDPEPFLLPSCVVIASGDQTGEELTLTGADYEGANSTIVMDVSGTWCLTVNGTKYIGAAGVENPVGAFIAIDGTAITTLPCENFTGSTGTLPDCVRLVFTDIDGVPAQDFVVDATGNTFIGELGSGTLVQVGNEWQLLINGATLIGGGSSGPFGSYVGGGQCALIKECGPDATLPDSLAIGPSDDPLLEGVTWAFTPTAYVATTPVGSTITLSDLTYNIGVGWVFGLDADGDPATVDSLYSKIGADALNENDPTGIYSDGTNQLIIS